MHTLRYHGKAHLSSHLSYLCELWHYYFNQSTATLLLLYCYEPERWRAPYTPTSLPRRTTLPMLLPMHVFSYSSFTRAIMRTVYRLPPTSHESTPPHTHTHISRTTGVMVCAVSLSAMP